LRKMKVQRVEAGSYEVWDLPSGAEYVLEKVDSHPKRPWVLTRLVEVRLVRITTTKRAIGEMTYHKTKKAALEWLK